MLSYPNPAPKPTWALLSACFAFRPGAPFTGLLSPAFFQGHADSHHLHFGSGEHDTFSAPLTLWAWISQALSGSKSCLAAAARVLVLCYSLNRPLPSANTGAYCKAPAKLPAAFLRDVATDLGAQMEKAAPEPWKWHGRDVRLVDGSILLLPDSEANLAEFPQQRSQKRGTSYACMRVVVLLAFATAALLDCACGAYRGKGTGEISLFYPMLERLQEGELLLGDRYYGSYGLLALLQGRGVDACFRLPVKREADFRNGQRLGADDYLHTWNKPETRPTWISKEDWKALPATLTVRVVHFQVRQRGFRTRPLYLVTTLTDHEEYSLEDLASLYRERGNVELDIRSIKQGLGVKLLSCKSPELVRAELWAHLLAYNLTRCVLAQAARDKGVKARYLSFKAAVQTLDAFRWLLSCQAQADGSVPALAALALSAALGVHQVGDRPDRYEPRETKHRQRKYEKLKECRQSRREALKEPQPEKKEKGRGKSRPSGRQRWEARRGRPGAKQEGSLEGGGRRRCGAEPVG